MSKDGIGKKVAIGAAVAGVAGYVAGILTAPKSGKETRKDIQKAAQTARANAEKQLKKLHTDLNNLIDLSKSKYDTASTKAKAGYDKALSAAKEARQKVGEMLSAMHDGDASDKDLDKAVKEASKALNHLKTYLKK
jgi:gas vesicle protein